MTKYQNGKIYGLYSHQTDDIYIGSTTQPLAKRKGNHIAKYKKHLKNHNYCYMTSYELVKYDDVYIELIENYPCNSKEELCKREGHLIREMDCVNKYIPSRQKKEHYQDNKEKIISNAKEYYKQNKEKLLIQKKEYYHENKEKLLIQKKEYREQNRTKILAKNRKYREQNKDRYKCEDCQFSCQIISDYTRHLKSKKHIKNTYQERT
jgi:hypothetical protein